MSFHPPAAATSFGGRCFRSVPPALACLRPLELDHVLHGRPRWQRTVAAQSQGETVREFSVETEKRRTFYEAEFTVSGQPRTCSWT